MARELVCGLIALALAVAYYALASALPVSLLADEVGADGVPKALAIMLGLLGLFQLARVGLRQVKTERGDTEGGEGLRAHLRALGLLAIAVLYVIVTPHAGYLVATVALLLAVTIYAGQRPSPQVAAVSVAGGAALWLSFAKLLGVALPPFPWG